MKTNVKLLFILFFMPYIQSLINNKIDYDIKIIKKNSILLGSYPLIEIKRIEMKNNIYQKNELLIDYQFKGIIFFIYMLYIIKNKLYIMNKYILYVLHIMFIIIPIPSIIFKKISNIDII